MAANTALLRTIPKVDEVLASPLFDPEQQLSHSVAVEAIRAVLEETREAILAGSLTEAPKGFSKEGTIDYSTRNRNVPR